MMLNNQRLLYLTCTTLNTVIKCGIKQVSAVRPQWPYHSDLSFDTFNLKIALPVRPTPVSLNVVWFSVFELHRTDRWVGCNA